MGTTLHKGEQTFRSQLVNTSPSLGPWITCFIESTVWCCPSSAGSRSDHKWRCATGDERTCIPSSEAKIIAHTARNRFIVILQFNKTQQSHIVCAPRMIEGNNIHTNSRHLVYRRGRWHLSCIFSKHSIWALDPLVKHLKCLFIGFSSLNKLSLYPDCLLKCACVCRQLENMALLHGNWPSLQ